MRNWYKENRERALAYQKTYRESHPGLDDIKKARKDFKELASVNPEEAKVILSQIEGEEGPKFRELLLDGIPEKLLNKNPEGEIDEY